MLGKLDDLIDAAQPRIVLDDVWHGKIAKAREKGLTWVQIAEAIAVDTDTEPLSPSTLADRHERWLKQTG